ncbi:MAG: DUF3034 family protein [Pseudomonadota bacterium]
MRSLRTAILTFICFIGTAQAQILPDRGRLLATAGVSQIEGQAGGGLAPWGVIAGYGTEASWGATGHTTLVNLSDYTVRSSGVAVGIRNRLEISYAAMSFDTEEVGGALGLGNGFTFDQDVYGAKFRLLGDLVTDQDSLLPQITIGVQHKHNRDGDIVALVGAQDDSSTDITLSATKLFLAQSLLVNATLRSTEAHQLGFLGFSDDRSLQFEGSVAALLSRRFAVGAEYRTKPDKLAFAEEEDAYDVFGAFFLNKHVSLTGAYVDLGSIAGSDNQTGSYVSVQGSF